MLLAVDVGNSTTTLGLLEGRRLTHHWRVSTDDTRTSDELALLLDGLVGFSGASLRELTGVVVASVVPPVTDTLRTAAREHLDREALVVAPGIRTGIPLRYEDPREIGADRIANAVAVVDRYGGPAVVVDFGTSTNFDAIDADGAFVGGAIAPGVAVSTQALVRAAAQLPEVTVERPRRAIGRTTADALRSGIVFGFAAQVDGIVRRIVAELDGARGPVAVVATGGLAPGVLGLCETVAHHDPWLTLDGLGLIWDRNA